MSGPFGLTSRKYLQAGFSPIPVPYGEKGCKLHGWTQYCDASVTDEQLTEWLPRYKDFNIGIALGLKVQVQGVTRQIVALDIDDDEIMPSILPALPGIGPTRRGSKGVAIFGLCPIDTGNKKFRRSKGLKPAVELLAHGSQVIVPPSMHPSGREYEWLGTSLLDTDIETWPLFGDAVLDEIAAICHGKGKCFDDLNDMVWLGVDGGGNTHDTCVSVVASLVARGWTDSDIRERIIRGKRDSVERAGEVYHWPEADQKIREWITSARAKGIGDASSRGERRTPPERLMAEWALATLGGIDRTKTVNGRLRTYKNGHWPEVDIPALTRSMYTFDSSLRRSEAENAVAILMTLTEVRDFGSTPDTEPRDDPKRQRLCLKNGTLNLRTGAMDEWATDHELLHQIDVPWNPDAECPIYNRVVSYAFADDEIAIETWDEFSALTLVDDMTFQRLLFLRGPGGNGKGTLARVLRNLHSPSAIGSVAVTDLNDERKRTSLVGKFVNISGEQSRFNTVADTYLKKITGGDPIDVRKLYGETQNNVLLSVRFVELVNEMPTTNDASDALKRRILLLDCPNKILHPDPDMDRKLMKERPGILRRFVAALHRLYQRGRFRVSEAAQQQIDAYLIENDPVAYWMAERLDPIEDIGLGSASNELWADFKVWSADMGYTRLLPEVVWGRKLTSFGYPSISYRPPGGQSVRFRKLIIKRGLEGPI